VQKRRLDSLIIGAVMTVALAGCGGGNNATSTGSGAAQTSAAQGTSTSQSTSTKQTNPPTRLGKLAYERVMQKLGNELGRSVQGLYPIASGPAGSATEKATVVELQKARGVVSNVLAQLTAIIPPPKVAPQHAMLERGARELSAQISALINDTQTGNLAAFAEGSSFSNSLQVITNAVDAMQVRGYDILGKQGRGSG